MSFWDNVKKFAQPYSDDDFDDLDDTEELFPPEKPARRTPGAENRASSSDEGGFGGKVIGTASNKPGVVLFRPISFSDSAKAADDLRERKAVIVNLENLDKPTARRVVDFLSGCSYALDGSVKKIAENTYLFCPHNMDVAGDLGGIYADTGL